MRNKWTMSLVLTLLLVSILPAQMPEPDAGANPGPGPGVAHISIMNGEVTTRRGDSGDWIASAPNAPLLAGDRIYSPRRARAEVQLDSGNFFRIGEDTEVQLADIEAARYQLQVSKGIVSHSIVRDTRGQAEIDTPLVAVRPQEPGLYRVEVLEDGQTRIIVRAGRAQVSSQQGSETVNAGQMLMVRSDGPGGEVQVQALGAPAPDHWDRWNEQRDRQLARAGSLRYVDPSISGVEDLDAYGNWQQVAGYGPVWYPRVEPGWSPYSYGRWVWIDGYGWSWVDYDPWGWAPFHYGRWFWQASFGWGWWPGPVGVPCYWSPALVGFFGWGSHVGFGFGYSDIGWVPLAPYERISPWWGRGYGGRTYVNNVQVTNITNITNVYHNAGVNGGIRSIPAQQFGQGGIVNHQALNAGSIRAAGQIHGMAPVVPTHNSLLVSNRPVNSSVLPSGGSTHNQFFALHQPSAVQRTPFVQQQQQAARAFGNAGSFQNANSGFANGPSMRGHGFNAPVQHRAGAGPQGGGFAPSVPQGGAFAPGGQQPSASSGAAAGGWHQLGRGGRPTGAWSESRPAGPVTNPAQSGPGNPQWRRPGEAGTQQFSGSPNGGGHPRINQQAAPTNAPDQAYRGGPVNQMNQWNRPAPSRPAPGHFETQRSYQAPAPSYSPAPDQVYRGGPANHMNQSAPYQPPPSHFEAPRSYAAPPPAYSRPAPPQSFGGGFRDDGGGRQLQIQRPIMTPRQSYSAPSAPSSHGGGPSFGGAAPTGGGFGAPSHGGGGFGGSQSGGGHGGGNNGGNNGGHGGGGHHR